MKNEPIRVLNISLTKSYGGIAAYQMNLYQNIDRSKVQFDFVTSYPKAAIEDVVQAMGARVYHLPAQKNVLGYMKALKKVTTDNQYKIVHIHKNSAANIMPFLVCKQSGVPTIIAHSHSTNAIDTKAANIPHLFHRGILGRYISKGFACSAAAAEWMYGKQYQHNNKDNKIEIAMNGIDIESFSYNPAVRDHIKADLDLSNAFVVGHVGNYIRPKNHRFILDIFKDFLKRKPDAKLLLLGTGALLEATVQYAQAIGVSDYVIFAGSKSNISEYYQAMDLFLMPSIHEGLPFAGVEAQAAGLQCFFSDTITKELAITELAHFISLEESPVVWAEKMMESGLCYQRKTYKPELQNRGYDASINAKRMEEFYISQIQ